VTPVHRPRPQAPVAAVIFDWGGTLTPWHTIDLRAQWTAFADGYGTLACARNDLAARLADAESRAWARSREGGHHSAHLDDILAEVGLDVSHGPTQAGLAAYRDFWEPHTLTHPHVEELFVGLRARGVRVGVLSNTIWDATYHRGIFERDGVLHLIDADVYSSELKHTKPHPEIFRVAAERVGVTAAECVYVGDRAYEDVHGGHAAGMRTILVPHSDIPHDQRVSAGSAQTGPLNDVPEAIAHELLDILGIVAGWSSGESTSS
jgi:putative hydrolase of the HAD superfamily